MVKLRHRAKFWGDRSSSEMWRFFNFSKSRPLPSRIFKISNFEQSQSSRGPNCVIVPNFVVIGQTVAQIYSDFSIFPRWRPSAILDLWYVRSDHPRKALAVFITVQNLVGIDATCFSISQVWLENAYQCPQNWGFGGIWHLNGEQYQRNPKSTSLRESALCEPSCWKICRRVWPVGEFPKRA